MLNMDTSLTECVRSGGSEYSSVSSLTGTDDSTKNWEFNLRITILNASWSSDLILLGQDGSSDDGNGVGGGTMISSHFSMELAYSTIKWNISVLLIHVVVSSSRFISKDNAEGLDKVGSAFKDFINC